MKVAFVKQKYDIFGPWSSIKWRSTNPLSLFKLWPSKALFCEMTYLLKADWYIIPSAKFEGDYIKGAIKDLKRVEVIDKYTTNVIQPNEIPYENYDIVITLDPILEVPKIQTTLFVYYVQEHWDKLYRKSLKKPLGNYDLFLAHILDSNSEIFKLPQAVSFPYLYSQEVVKNIFNSKKEEKIWADWRTLTTLSQTEKWETKTERAAKRLEKYLGLPVYCRGDFNKNSLGISDPPLWGDAYNYLREMSKCKYYVGVGRAGGAGQALGDAASLGCICIGELTKPYHRLICHPKLLCTDLFDLPEVFKKVGTSPQLQREALKYQNQILKKKFTEEPINLLKKALELKRKYI